MTPVRGPQEHRTADWRKYNAEFWRRDFEGFAAWFVGEKMFSEPHSTKPIEDGIGWTLDTDAETLITVEPGPYLWPPASGARVTRTKAGRSRSSAACAVLSLVIHGTDDRISSVAVGDRAAPRNWAHR